VRGTDFSRFKTYAFRSASQKTPDPKHPVEDIEAALLAKGLQKVGMDDNPDLVVAFGVGHELVYPIQNYLKTPVVKQGTLTIELADPLQRWAARELTSKGAAAAIGRRYRELVTFLKSPPTFQTGSGGF
jgi:hypothetical protein